MSSTEVGSLPVGRSSPDALTLGEALWRGEELQAALDAANVEISELRRQLAAAQWKISDLGEIASAAQAAINQLRTELCRVEADNQQLRDNSELLAAELFRAASENVTTARLLGKALYFAQPATGR
ncbi:MAG: hypothetical protein JO213_19175 [Alphaproteobacteria bacterium]|nr:hypothetical protein [Alphaproteobacteria bacterium]